MTNHVCQAHFVFRWKCITVGGLLIAFVYAKTSPIMFIKAKEEKEAALKTMMPDAKHIAKLGDWAPHEKHAEYYAAQECGELKVTTVKDEKTGQTFVKIPVENEKIVENALNFISGFIGMLKK